MSLKNFKPGVSKYWLLTLAGLMWSGVGTFLCRRAYTWFTGINIYRAILFELISILMALAVHRFGFAKIASRNITRLCLLTERTCVFAFQTWKGYLIIGLMIGLGYILRSSTFPKQYLAMLYTAVGGALFLSSFSYYRLVWEEIFRK